MIRTPKLARLLLAGCLIVPAYAWAAVALTLSPNYDGTLDTKYPSGNKPFASCTAPSGWTVASIGNGGGEICQISSTEFDFSVYGTSSIQNQRLAYKSGGTGDIQIIARVTDEYAGNLDSLTSLGIGLRDGAGATDYFVQGLSPYAGASSVLCNYGTTASAFSSVDGATGLVRPRYIAVTHDRSENVTKVHESSDGSTWVEVCSVTRTFVSNPIVSVFGVSRSSTATMQGTLDNIAVGTTITVYTPSAGGGGGSPVLVSEIPAQSGTQGQAFSLDVSAYFTGATSYSASGLPSALTINTSTGVISGTPASSGVSNVTATATNGSGSTSDSFSLTVSASSGDTFTIPASASARTFNCGTAANWTGLGGTGTPGPGDTIVLAGGTHAGLQFRNCVGSSSARITIRNDTAAAVPATVATSTAVSGTIAALTIRDSEYVTVDGLGGWSGQAANRCGRRSAGVWDTAGCGIRVDSSTQNALHMRGLRRNLTVQGVEVDGNWPVTATTTGSQVGISLTDHTYCQSDHPGEWVENVTLTRMYVHHTAKEAMYLGPNVSNTGGSCTETGGVVDEPRLRNISVTDNLVQYGGWDGIELKSARQGTNYITGNKITNIGGGVAGSGANSRGISCYESSCEVENNVIDTTSAPPGGAPGISCSLQAAPATWCTTPAGGSICECNVRGNTVADVDGYGVGYSVGTAPESLTGIVEYNTVVRAGKSCINIDSSADASGIVRYNIAANASGSCAINDGPFAAPSGTNLNTQVSTQGFTSTDDFSLTSGSTNRNSGGSSCSDLTDPAGVIRPKGAACDRGAYEFDE